MRALGVIPARYASTRFPGKALAPILGRPMVRWVYERARAAARLDRVIVATDDERILRAVEAFGGEAVMTPATCASGTDRVWAAARNTGAEVVVNLQGDEPALDPLTVDALVDLMAADADLQMGTVVTPLDSDAALGDPNVVKAVLTQSMRCLYFSRSPVPFARNPPAGWRPWGHVGLYAFRKAFLERFTSWPPSPLESIEALEQLRAIENGAAIGAVVSRAPYASVDVPGDVPRAEALLRKLGLA